MFPIALVQILIVLIVVGLILWGISQFPLDPTIARVIRVIVIVVVGICLIYLLFGLMGGAGTSIFRR